MSVNRQCLKHLSSWHPPYLFTIVFPVRFLVPVKKLGPYSKVECLPHTEELFISFLEKKRMPKIKFVHQRRYLRYAKLSNVEKRRRKQEIKNLFSDWQSSKSDEGWPKCSKKKDTFESNETFKSTNFSEHSCLDADVEYNIFESETSNTKSVVFKKESEESDENDEEVIFDQNIFQNIVKEIVLHNNEEFRITKVALSIIQVYFVLNILCYSKF